MLSACAAQQANSQSIRMSRPNSPADDAAPLSPFAPEGADPRPPFIYQLPAAAPVTDGLASVSASGVRSRGLTLAAYRGLAVAAPADGVVKFAGPFRDYDGVLIIDHGGGWLSLIVNVASELHAGDRVRLGDPARPRARARYRSNCPTMGDKSRQPSSQVHLNLCQRRPKAAKRWA